MDQVRQTDEIYGVDGMIFLANKDSINEMLDRMILGMDPSAFKRVRRIKLGTPIILYDLHNMVFHGCFVAVTPGTYNLDPFAFGGNKRKGSPRPAQVRVEYSEHFPPTLWWLFENVPGLFYAGTNKVDQILNEEQIEEIRTVFYREHQRQKYNLGPPLPCPPLRPQQGPPLQPGHRPAPWTRPYGEPLDTYIRKELSHDYYNVRDKPQGPQFLDPIDDGTFTSVIMKNIPLGLTGDMFVDSLVQCGFYGCFDFVLMRTPTPQAGAQGHAIVNFTTREAAEAIYYEWGNIQQFWPPYNLGRLQRPVSWAKAQGVEGLQGLFNFVIPVIQGDPSQFHISDSTAYIFELPEKREYSGTMYVPRKDPDPQERRENVKEIRDEEPDDGELDEGEIPPEIAATGIVQQAEDEPFQMPNGLSMKFPVPPTDLDYAERGRKRKYTTLDSYEGYTQSGYRPPASNKQYHMEDFESHDPYHHMQRSYSRHPEDREEHDDGNEYYASDWQHSHPQDFKDFPNEVGEYVQQEYSELDSSGRPGFRRSSPPFKRSRRSSEGPIDQKQEIIKGSYSAANRRSQSHKRDSVSWERKKEETKPNSLADAPPLPPLRRSKRQENKNKVHRIINLKPLQGQRPPPKIAEEDAQQKPGSKHTKIVWSAPRQDSPEINLKAQEKAKGPQVAKQKREQFEKGKKKSEVLPGPPPGQPPTSAFGQRSSSPYSGKIQLEKLPVLPQASQNRSAPSSQPKTAKSFEKAKAEKIGQEKSKGKSSSQRPAHTPIPFPQEKLRNIETADIAQKSLESGEMENIIQSRISEQPSDSASIPERPTEASSQKRQNSSSQTPIAKEQLPPPPLRKDSAPKAASQPTSKRKSENSDVLETGKNPAEYVQPQEVSEQDENQPKKAIKADEQENSHNESQEDCQPKEMEDPNLQTEDEILDSLEPEEPCFEFGADFVAI